MGGARSQGGGPALAPSRGADSGREQARGHVHPLQTAAQDQRVITRIPAHARLDVASDAGRALADVGEKRRGAEVAGGRHPGLQGVMGGIQALPDLRGEGLPGAASILPGGGQRTDNRARLVLVITEQFQDGSGIPVLLGGVARNAHDSQQDSACARLVHTRVFEYLVEMHVKQPGGVLRPLDVPADPEKRLGDPAQHPALLIAAGPGEDRDRVRCRGPPARATLAARRLPGPSPARKSAPRCPWSRRPGWSLRSGCPPAAPPGSVRRAAPGPARHR